VRIFNLYLCSGGFGESSDKEVEYLDRYSGQWQVGPDRRDAVESKTSRVRHCMVILGELDIIDIGGWKQPRTVGSFNFLEGNWTYKKDAVEHNDR